MAFPFSSLATNTEPKPAQIEIETTPLKPQTISDDQAIRLSQCQTLDVIKEWVQKEGLNLREDAHVGAAILAHILKRNQANLTMEEIAAYICDPTFHPPGTSFILRSVGGILRRNWGTTEWTILRQSICSATELGLLSVDDIRKVIVKVRRAQSTRSSNAHGPLENWRERAKLYMICGILESVDRSTVLQLMDLTSPFLSKLFSRFAAHVHLTWCEMMVWRLLPWAPKHYVGLIRRLTLRRLQYQHGRLGSNERVGQALANRLVRADPEVLQLVLANTTEGLLKLSKERDTMLYRFLWRHWCGTLAVLGSQNFNVSLTKHTWKSLQAVKSLLSPNQRSLAFVWTALSLYRDLRTSIALSDRLRFLDCFEELIGSLPNFAKDSLDHIVVELKDLALPNKDVLLRNLKRLANQDEDLLFTSIAKLDFNHAVQQNITLSILGKGMQNAHVVHSEALAAISHQWNYDIPTFKVLSRRIIQKSTKSFGLVCQLLEKNTMLKIALQMPQHASRPIHASREKMTPTGNGAFADLSAPGDVERTTSCPPEPSTTTSSLATKEEMIDLINHLAVSFATSPVATPREALRRVYWCVRFLGRYRVPIQPIVTRALWHAGVTRYGEQGTAAALLKWILWRVREVEGDDVARQLLWSRRFRLSRTEQVDAWNEIDEEEERAALALLKEEPISESQPESNLTCQGNEAGEKPSSSSPSPSILTSDVDTLLRGEVDLELRKKIMFLQSEPPDEPFWLTRQKARHHVRKMTPQEMKRQKRRQQEAGSRRGATGVRRTTQLLLEGTIVKQLV